MIKMYKSGKIPAYEKFFNNKLFLDFFFFYRIHFIYLFFVHLPYPQLLATTVYISLSTNRLTCTAFRYF